ncbi:MAG: hypothetical protein M1831_001151 [Alyxoria varia]|nr:MAG: hypothetical protein M1831_001151 [Alyxoria varia]
MPKPSSPFHFHSRRYSSSGSNNVGPSQTNNPENNDLGRPSSPGTVVKGHGATSSVNKIIDTSEKTGKQRSFHRRRFSGSTSRLPDDPGNTDGGVGGQNRWSQSTGSSISTGHHRRHSSFSKRFSIGASPLSPVFRSVSPSKRYPNEPVPDLLASNPPDNSQMLPMRRFSPLSLPSFSQASPVVDQFGHVERTQPWQITNGRLPPNTREGPQLAQDDMQNSTSKRPREPYAKGDPLLSNIQESTRSKSPSTQAAATPLPEAESSMQAEPSQESSRKKRSASREQSPGKRRHRKDRDGSKDHAKHSDRSGEPGRKRSRREKEKKIMLSKALQRANEAVHLDNEQKYTQAVTAYGEACELLDSVMSRTSSEDDKGKLTAIRGTYMTRVNELKRLTDQSKPISDAFSDHGEESTKDGEPAQSEVDGKANKDLPPKPDENGDHTAESQLSPPSHTEYMPPPLSPRRSPVRSSQNSPIPENAPLPNSRVADQRESGITDAYQHFAKDDTESWFNATGEEPVSASSSPNHSISSAGGLKKRDLRNVVDTEAEFDAALDAAVEAAYNDGYEIYDDEYPGDEEEVATKHTSVRSDDPIAQAERSRAEREAEMRAVQNRVSFHQKNRDIFSVAEETNEDEQATDLEEEDHGAEFNSADADNHHDPHVPRISDSSGFSGRTKGSSAASSTNTAGTSLSTVDENASQPSYGAKLQQSKTAPSASPPTSAPPPPPSSTKPANLKSNKMPEPNESGQNASFQNPVLIERRMSGQKKGQNLKIETALAHSRDVSEDARSHKAPTECSQDSDSKTVTGPALGEYDPSGSPDRQTLSQSRSNSRMAGLDTGSPPQPSPFGSSFPSNSLSPPTPTYPGASPVTASPGKPFGKERPPQMRNQSSSMSIRKAGLLGRTDTNDGSPNSPMAFAFAQSAASPPDRLLQLNSTPMTASFGSAGSAGPIRVPYFDNDIHSPHKPGVPNTELANGPKPLEHCPESQLLRPFWFLRCLHETLANPKGGYISNKLFVPHDVWKVKNVKLKGLEDKVAACDHLIAGLLKLGGVDTLDAEAVADEMREFESVVDNVQGTLQKKLGNEVGIKEIGTLFKDAPHMTANTASDSASNANDAGTTVSGSSKSGSKSWGQSWRKLRSKSSGATVGTPSSRGISGSGLGGDMILSSVPMTTSLTQSSRSRSMHRKDSIPHPGKPIDPHLTGLTDLSESPYAKYAKALAEMCEAAQILDQIGRQAEDPGLKGVSEAHVGLELSSRRAAEFFALYICRFALQDVTMLTEKYLKRASEWVLI